MTAERLKSLPPGTKFCTFCWGLEGFHELNCCWYVTPAQKQEAKQQVEKEAQAVKNRNLFFGVIVVGLVLLMCWWGSSNPNKHPEDSPYYSN